MMNKDLENLLLQAAGCPGSSTCRPDGKGSAAANAVPEKPRNRSSNITLSASKGHQVEKGSKDKLEEMNEADSDGTPPFGSDLYMDDEDKVHLEKMSELEREMILAERSTRWDDYRLKQMAKERSEQKKLPKGAPRMQKDSSPPPPVVAPAKASAGRTSTRGIEKAAATQSALEELRARRMRQKDSKGYQNHLKNLFQDGLSNSGRPAPETSCRNASPPSEGVMSDGEELPEDSPREERLRFEDIRDVTIPRSRLLKWFMDPFFEDLLPGCFIRIGIHQYKDGSRKYRLYMVKTTDASDPTKTYNFENYATHKYLILVSCAGTSDDKCKMTEASDFPPLEEEFYEWLKMSEKRGMRVPTCKELKEKKDEIDKALNFVYSAQTVKHLIQEKKSVLLWPTNVAAEKGRLRNDLVVARAQNNAAEAERILSRLKQLEQMQAEHADSKAARLVEMNRRNRADNFKNASDLKPVNTKLKAGDVGYDPSSRRWTRPTMVCYKQIGEGSSTNSAANTIAGTRVGGTKEAHATAVTQDAMGQNGQLVNTEAPVDGNASLYELHNFEVKIDLAKTFSLGSTVQERVMRGNMLRRRRQESSIGRNKVRPDSDSASHPFTISVEEYKRRRGMK